VKLSKIALKIRLANTDFGSMVGGSAQLSQAIKFTLKVEAAFVIPLDDDAASNSQSGEVIQDLTERFAVVVAIKNDTSQSDKLGITSYDRIHDIRAQLWRALLGWRMQVSDKLETNIYYRRSKIVGMDDAWLWYQFEFESMRRIEGGTAYEDIEGVGVEGDDTFKGTITEESQLSDFDTIYMQLIEGTSTRLIDAHGLELPVNSGLTDSQNWIDLTINPNSGAYAKAFGLMYKVDES